jgi:D-alanyl-D-alanine carboxypeptidase/D-alanyl-D-alanine-endopeptidase (penicillin-binding protein 4)
MARRQRSRAAAPTLRLALALAPLLGLAGACSDRESQAAAPVDEPPPVGLAPADRPVLAALPTRTLAPDHAARAERLTARFRTRIAAAVEQARKLSKGKATAGNVHVAVTVREVGAPAELVELRADRAQPPASNLKLVTTAAALVLCGRSAAWVTPVEGTGALVGGRLDGDLVFRAAGDPVFDPTGLGRVEERFRALGQRLAERGLAHVTGDLVLDEGDFLEPGPGPEWPDPSQHWTEYCARSGGFTANGGVICARVRPAAVGAPARLEVHPEPHGLRSSYGVDTVAGTVNDVRVGATTTTATVRGRVGHGLEEVLAEFSHPDPVQLFGALALDGLQRAGIRVDGTVRRQRGVPEGVRLGELRGSLAECMEAVNAESRNGVADQVFLSLGHVAGGGGTREGGRRAVARALQQLGVPEAGLNQVDGSGLSRANRVSARAVTALLEAVLGADDATAALFRDSLAVAGRKGTLEKRMGGTAADGRVFAKTGWIRGVSCLSGLATPPDRPALVFSILIEYPEALGGLNTDCFKPLQDDLVLMLFEDPR